MFRTRLFSAPCRSARAGDCPWVLAQVRAAHTKLQRQRQEFAQKQVIGYAARLDFGGRAAKGRRGPGSSFFCLGDQRLKKIEALLDNMSVSRTDDQIDMHLSFLNALLPFIFGVSEWPSVEYRILKERGLERIEPLQLCFAKRRVTTQQCWRPLVGAVCGTQLSVPLCAQVGKTWSVALLSTAILLTIPGFEETIFRYGQATE